MNLNKIRNLMIVLVILVSSNIVFAQVFHCVSSKGNRKCNFLAVGIGYEVHGQKFSTASASGELHGAAPRVSIYLKRALKSSQLVLQYSSSTSKLTSPDDYTFTNEPGPFSSVMIGWGKNTKFVNFMVLLGQQKYPLVTQIDTSVNIITLVPSSQNFVGLSLAKGMFALQKWETAFQLDVSALAGQADQQIESGIHYSIGLRSVMPLKKGLLFSLASLSFINQDSGLVSNSSSQSSFQLGYSF